MRNHTGTLIRPNNENGKRSRAKIPTGSLPGVPGNLCTRAHYQIDYLGIGRNRTGTPIGKNDEYLKWSRSKIVTGALLGVSRN